MSLLASTKGNFLVGVPEVSSLENVENLEML